jgi:hypothetical protein
VENGWAAVALDFHHILPGERVGPGEIHHKAFIQGLAGRVAEGGEMAVAGTEGAPSGEGKANGLGLGTGNADHPHPTPPGRGGDGGDGPPPYVVLRMIHHC